MNKPPVIVVLKCPDSRNKKPTRQALEELGLREEDYIENNPVGASLTIEDVVAWLKKAQEIFFVTEIVLIDHLTCKYYLHRYGEERMDDHHHNLIKARKEVLRPMFPNISIRLFIMPDDGAGGMKAELIRVEDKVVVVEGQRSFAGVEST